MTVEQLTYIEDDLGLRINTRFVVELLLHGQSECVLKGEYTRDDSLVRIKSGLSEHWIDISSIASLGVRQV